MAVVGVRRARAIENGAGKNRLRKDAGSVVNQLGKSVGGADGEAMRQPLLQFRRGGVVAGVGDIVAEQSHSREARERPQQLLLCDGRAPQGRRSRNLSQVRIRHFGQQRRAHGKVL